MSKDAPITWRGRDLSTDDAIMYYRGRFRNDPYRPSAYLLDLENTPLLEEVLWSGDYEVEIRVIRRAPTEDDQTASIAALDQVRLESEILAQEGGSADDAEFAVLVGCTVSELLARSQRREFFSVELFGHRHWPRWQLGLAGMADVLPVLAEKEASGFSVALFFTTSSDELSLDDADDELPDVREDDSPLSLLRRCGTAAVPRVVRLARRIGEHGAT